jgi:hypothetical protein
MSLSHFLLTRAKAKASLRITAVITILFISLTVNVLLHKRATADVEPANMKIQLRRAVNILDFQPGPSAAVDVVELSRRLPEIDPYSNITTALCCKAMYGNVDMTRVALWVAYHRLLGFEHVFLYYHDVIADFPGFDELESLPYLTMTPMKGKVVELLEKSLNSTNGTRIPYSRFVGEDMQHANQHALEIECFNNHAKDYDWVMIADIDEYLSFNEEMGVKDFIAKYSDESTKSLGIGKKMYTLTARVDTVDSGFGLDHYPFTPGIFCLDFFLKYFEKQEGMQWPLGFHQIDFAAPRP